MRRWVLQGHVWRKILDKAGFTGITVDVLPATGNGPCTADTLLVTAWADQRSDAYVRKLAHAAGETPRRGPWAFLESRTRTEVGVVATSTQSLPLLLSLYVLLNHSSSGAFLRIMFPPALAR